MMSSLFEVYDSYSFFFDMSFNWFSLIMIILVSYTSYWFVGSSYFLYSSSFFFFLFSEFSLFFSLKALKPVVSVFVFLFFFFLFINLFGLLPYVFSSSSHFVFCLSFSFPLWLGFMLVGWVSMSNQMFSHLIPLGTPLVLIVFMVVIETVSQAIRPWSLAVRLMANMVSGHLLMSLLGDCGSSFFFVQVVFFCFEFFVCFIQAYVFCALLVLYYGEL